MSPVPMRTGFDGEGEGSTEGAADGDADADGPADADGADADGAIEGVTRAIALGEAVDTVVEAAPTPGTRRAARRRRGSRAIPVSTIPATMRPWT